MAVDQAQGGSPSARDREDRSTAEDEAAPEEEPLFVEDDETMDVHSVVRQVFGEFGDGDEARSAYLIVIAGSQVGELCRIGDDLRVGRGPGVDFRLVDNGVSKQHLRLRRHGDGSVRIEDKDSRNGTYVNGERISDTVLSDGDKIHLGSTTILKFSVADRLEATFQQRMYDAAVHDALTGLYNRRRLMEHLTAEFSYARRHATPLSMIMIDIDNFKRLNDTHGHPVGDLVISGLARRIIACVRVEDLPARYGGEEFAIVCRGIEAPGAAVLADRLRRVVEADAMVPQHREIKVTISAGVADLTARQIDSPEALMTAADEALYRAKRAGRNRVCLYPSPSR